MAEQEIYTPVGLYTSPNSYSASPPGSLTVADNCVIDRKGIVDSRRGNAIYSTDLTNVSKLFKYRDHIIAHYDSKLALDNSGTFTDYSGTYVQPDPAYKMRSVLSNQNFYFTTTKGIYKLSSLSGTPKPAGIPPALDLQSQTDGTSGFLDNNHGVAYRIIWGLKDENDNLLLGAPSMRSIVYNTSGGQRNIQLTFTIPDEITTEYFYQVYRSYDVTSTSIEPSDELYLVYESNPTSGEISSGLVTVVDNTPFDLMGAVMYASATQEGIDKSNYQPPYCKDIDTYKNHTFFANTKLRQQYISTLVAIGSPNGLVNDDTIVIDGITFTGKAAENIASNEFKIYTSGTLAENIDNTAQSLVRVVNRSTTATVYAFYVSAYNDLPGKIRFAEKSIGGSSFALTSSRGTAFSPQLPSSGTTESSTSDQRTNGLYFSKPNQPEAVPLLQYLLVGSAEVAIERIVALRDSMFIFKADGIYRLSGDDSTNFSITLFDNTSILLARESAVPANNTVMGWFNQGICSVSDGGVAVVSEPIYRTLLELSSSNFPNFGDVTFGISYETDRKYIVYTNSAVNDTYGTQAFVFNYQTGSWTRWTNHRACGIIGPDGHLFGADTTTVYRERKEYTPDDFADESWEVTVTAVNGLDVTLTDASNCQVGYTLRQDNAFSVITAINGDVVTVSLTINWDLSTAEVFKPIPVSLEFNPMTADDPSRLKHWQEIIFSFNTGFFNTITGSFTSDFCFQGQEVVVEGNYLSTWGMFPWDSIPWGVDTSKIKAYRTYVPYEAAKSHHLNVSLEWSEAFVNPSVMGFALVFDWMSTKYQG